MINYELLKNDCPPAIIEKDHRVKYYEMLKRSSSKELAEWLKELSEKEEERMKHFGYKG